MRTTLKLVLPLIISVALVSLLFAGYQVRTQRRNLRSDLSRRAEVLAESLQETIEPLFAKNERNSERAMQRVVDRFAQREHMKGIAVYEAGGNPSAMTATLGGAFRQAPGITKLSIESNAGRGEFTQVAETPVFLYALPLDRDGKVAGSQLYLDRRLLFP